MAVLAVMGFMCFVLILTPTQPLGAEGLGAEGAPLGDPLAPKSFSTTSNSLRLHRAGLRILDRQNPDVEDVRGHPDFKDVRRGSTGDPLDASTDAYWESRGVQKPW